MLNLCGIVAAILNMATGRNFSMSGINSGRHNLPTYEMALKIGQCWICAVLCRPFWKWRPVKIFQCRESIRDIIGYPHIKFWWYRTMLKFCVLWRPFWKWGPVEIFQCRESIRDIIVYPHIKFRWYQTMLNILCRILAAILKMADISKILKT
jgi:hypothetical protein